MRRLIIILTVLLIFISCDFKSAEDYFREAEKFENQEKYKEAILLLDRAIEKDNKLIGAYINRGADKSILGDFSGAINDYTSVLQIDTNNTMALFNIGNNYKRLKEYEKAVEYYNKAFDTKGGQNLYFDSSPNNFVESNQFDIQGHEIHFERGIALYFIDSLEKSYEDFYVSIRKNYMTADCYYWIGHIYLATGQKNLACENLKKSIQLGDKDAEADYMKYCDEGK